MIRYNENTLRRISAGRTFCQDDISISCCYFFKYFILFFSLFVYCICVYCAFFFVFNQLYGAHGIKKTGKHICVFYQSLFLLCILFPVSFVTIVNQFWHYRYSAFVLFKDAVDIFFITVCSKTVQHLQTEFRQIKAGSILPPADTTIFILNRCYIFALYHTKNLNF